MEKVHPDLKQDINTLPNARERIIIKGQNIVIMVLAGVVGLLFAMLVRGNNSSSSSKEKRIAQLESDLIEERKQKAHKDSLYTNCLINAARGQQEDIEEKNRRKYQKEITLRIQDSLIKIINSRSTK